MVLVPAEPPLSRYASGTKLRNRIAALIVVFKLEMINLSDHEYVHEELRQRAKSNADAWPNVSGSGLGFPAPFYL